MKVIWTMFNQASGKLAGIVGISNRGGDCIRARVVPSNPRTTQQSRMRAILTSCAAYWRGTMSDTNRDNWNSLGTAEKTGMNLFTAANATLLQGGGTLQPVAPASAAGIFTPFTESTDTTPTVGQISIAADGILYWNPANATDSYQLAAGGVINFYVSDPQSETRGAQQHNFTWRGSAVRAGAAFTGVNTVDCNMTNLTAGDIVYLRVTSAGVDGKVGPSQELRATVLA